MQLQGPRLNVGDGGLEARVPVDQAVVPVHQPLRMQPHKRLQHGRGAGLVQREHLAAGQRSLMYIACPAC